MGRGEPSGPGGQVDWPMRIAGAVGGALGGAAALLLGPVLGIDGFLPGALGVLVGVGAGVVLGRLVGEILFRRPPGDLHDDAAGRREQVAPGDAPIPACPDCCGEGYTLMIDPIADRTDTMGPAVRFFPVPCLRCHQTGSVPDAAAGQGSGGASPGKAREGAD